MSVYFTKGYLYQIALFFILQEAIESPFCHRIYLTRINQEFEADAFFPMFDENVYKLIRYLYCWCHRLAQWLTEISPTTSLHFLEGGNSFNRFLSIKQCGLLRRRYEESKVNNRRLFCEFLPNLMLSGYCIWISANFSASVHAITNCVPLSLFPVASVPFRRQFIVV